MPLLQFEGSSPKGEDSGNNFEVNSLSIDVFCKRFWVFQKSRRFTTFLFNQGTSHLYSNNV